MKVYQSKLFERKAKKLNKLPRGKPSRLRSTFASLKRGIPNNL